MSQATYFCARPRLASKLMAEGNDGTPTANPFHPERPAWSFIITPTLADTVAHFYVDINRPVPRVIADYLANRPI